LTETRILLPGTQVFLGFLVIVPFDPRFDGLSFGQRAIYLCTFYATMLALACFVMPATYHRIARRIHHTRRFKVLASGFLVAGLVPITIAVVLARYLVTSVVLPAIAPAAATVIAVVLLAAWWALPFAWVHHRVHDDESEDG
jgi:hypothetical protein